MSSQSTSFPVIPGFDQQLAQFLQQISGIAAGIGQQVYNWGQGVYNNVANVTDANIGRYLDQANAAGGLAQNIMQQYENVAAPEYNALVQQADQYASTPFVKQQMGEAEAQQAQAGDAARQNAIKDLQSYGIDPSAGRYAALDRAERTATGAAEAAAGTQSALATKAQGIGLRQAAVTAGQQLPGAAVNATNSALQGIAGAENSILGAANTGVNLQQAPAPFFNAAMGLRYPPSGQQTQSTSAPLLSSSSGKDPFGQPRTTPTPYPSQGGEGGGGGQSGRSSNDAQPGPQAGMIRGQLPGPANTGDPNAMGRGGGGGPGGVPGIQQVGPYDSTGNQGGGQDPFAASPGGGAQDFGQGATDFGIQPTAQDYGGGATDFGVPQGTAGFGPQDFGGGATDFAVPQAPATDYGGGATDFAVPQAPATDYGGGATDFGYSQPSYQDPNLDSGGGNYGGDTSYTSGDTGGGYGDGSGDYAQGGAIPSNATTGGHVPQSASPSNGQQTDDIPANLNAREFVMPTDVADWKGQEFFHKLIADSRMKRQQMTAATGTGAQMKPQAQGPVRFQSQRMGQ